MSEDNEKPKGKTKYTQVETKTLKALYDYFESKLTHPHGQDEFETHKKEVDGKIESKRIHVSHTHMPNIRDSHEHRWFHHLGALLGIHEYEIIEK